ncbi:FdtA/QdtA family cupin domain-containing protein [Phytohabitans sp. ZYX-F-186]|uniref:FdtA/QdtA family cupin domain-containing protein n=1 Tax=Phytohabitans maris TaxID=3071409 RepID=A0ABU0ZKB2_9ACTN|nr:FdtA/QdtA family cupin domain-containing protein [Phytohabitans sp. ZYX-F-186]MDQ7907418.1 FdtA/QdtA family cupin domain-containing protein [Phytohabitans sp. ZYX-F-186]
MTGAAASTRSWNLVALPRFVDDRGALTVVETGRQVDFRIARVYYLYGVPPRTVRGGHVHHTLHQLLVATSGALDAVVDDGWRRETIRLDDPSRGLYIGPMVWRELAGFTADAVCLVLASAGHDASDYSYDYERFRRYITQGAGGPEQ